MGRGAVPESDPITETRRTRLEATKAGDAAAIAALYCEDAVFMPANDTTLYGRAEVQEWWQEYFEHFRVVTLTETERQVTVSDGWAIERWCYTVAIAPIKGGERIRDDGRVLALWRQEPDGNWRTAQEMVNSIRPIGSGTSRYLALMRER